MNLLTPLTGLLVAMAVIPALLLLYFLKLRRKPQAISCTILWKKSIEDLRANAPFQRLRKNILLLLQLIALTMLILSVMQPQIQGRQSASERTVLFIDNSASMTATDIDDNGTTRLDEAKRLATDWVESVYTGGLFGSDPAETMIVSFNDNDRATIVTRFTKSKQQLLSAIESIHSTHGQTDIAQAFQLARAYTTNPNPDDADRPIAAPASFELFSDGRIGDLREQVLRGETLTYHPIGSPEADNVGLTTLSVERPYDKPTAVEVFVAVVNYNQQPVTCDLQLSLNDTTLSVQETSVGPATIDQESGELIPGKNNVVFTPFEQPAGAVISVENLRADHLASDNLVQQVVPPPKRLRVALVDPEPFGLRTVLEGLDLEELRIISGEEFNNLAATGGVDQFDVIVLDDFAPESMPPGRYLSFGATPPVGGLNEFGDPGQGLIILDSDDQHPSLRYVNTEELVIGTYHKLAPGDDVQILAEGSGAPAIVAVSRSGVELIHVVFGVLDSNWPWLRSIVAFVYNSVEVLGRSGEGLTMRGYRPGEAISARVPTGVTQVEILLPDGQTQPVESVALGSASWGPIRLSGMHVLSWEDPATGERQSLPIAVNSVSDREGDVRAVDQLMVSNERITGEVGGGSRYVPLWPYAIGMCIIVLLLEWWVYHRKAFV